MTGKKLRKAAENAETVLDYLAECLKQEGLSILAQKAEDLAGLTSELFHKIPLSHGTPKGKRSKA